MSTPVDVVKGQLEATQNKLTEHKSYLQKIEDSIKQLMAERDKVVPLINAHEGAIQAFLAAIEAFVPGAAPVVAAVEAAAPVIEGVVKAVEGASK